MMLPVICIEGEAVNIKKDSVVVFNKSFKDARWGDLLKGEEVGNAAVIDIGKIQMFFFTFIIVITYASAHSKNTDSRWAP